MSFVTAVYLLFIALQLLFININQPKAPVNKVACTELIINILSKMATHEEKKRKVMEGAQWWEFRVLSWA
jgi:hypothetical protein